jgi:hypothetical protein
MTVKSAPYYWLTCDAPTCGVSSTEDSEYTAWGDQGTAVMSAVDSDWFITDDGRHYCSEHANRVCHNDRGDCPNGQPFTPAEVDPYPGERDYLCPPCWSADIVALAAAAGQAITPATP